MLYTSGTTGNPKGCVLTNAYFLCPVTGTKTQAGSAPLLRMANACLRRCRYSI